MTQEEKLLIKILTIFTFATSTASVFLGLFLFKIGGFSTVAQFYVVYLFFLLVAYIASGWTLQKFSSSQAIQIGLFLYSLSYLLLVTLGQNAIHFLPLLGILFGISSGTFWSGNNLSQYILTSEHSRNEYFSKLNAFSNIASTAGPLLGGGIISLFVSRHFPLFGYTTVFALVGVLLLSVGFLSRQLPFHSSVVFSIRHFLRGATRNWRIVLAQQFLIGLYDTAFNTLCGILIFLIVRTELRVGIVNAASTLLSALISFYTAQILSRYKKSYVPGMIAMSIGIFLFGYLHNYTGLVILVAIVLGLSSFLGTPTSKAILDTLDTIPGEWQKKYHFLIERDTFLGTARTISWALLLFFLTKNNSLEVVTKWIMAIAIIPAVVALLQISLTKEKKSEQEAVDFEVVTEKPEV